jgi:ABC-2 type transport system permease protein
VLLVMIAFGSGNADTLPLIVALGILSTSFQGLSMQLAMHRDQGVLKGLMATPLTPLTFVTGKILSALIVIAIETFIVVAVGVAVTDASLPKQPLLLIAMIVLGTATFTSLGFAVASVIPTSDAAPAIVNGAYLGMILASIGIAQVDALDPVGAVMPLNQLFESIHDAWLGGGDTSYLLAAAVLVGWSVLATAWTARRFRWEPREAIS